MSAPANPARLLAAHEAARAFYRDRLHTAAGPRRYLTDRGLGTLVAPGTGAPWHLGYAPPGWTALVEHLTGFTRAELLAAGLATLGRTGALADLFRDRIMVPVHDTHGRPVGFLGRAAPGAGPAVPKYLNSPDTAIYHKGQTLYGLGEQPDRITAGWAPVIVEGPFDVIAVHLAYPDDTDAGQVAVATCGTTLTPHHIAAITALPGATGGITTAYDNDPAGHTATLRAFDLLHRHVLPSGLRLYAADLPAGADPGDLATSPDGPTQLRAALGARARPLATAAVDIELDLIVARRPDALAFAEGRLAAVRRLASRIAHLPAQEVVGLVEHIAARTGAPLETVTQAVIDALEAPTPRDADSAVRWAP